MSHKEKRLSLKKKVESAPAQHIEDDLHGDNSHVFITRDGHTKIVSKEEKARLEWQKKNHERVKTQKIGKDTLFLAICVF